MSYLRLFTVFIIALIFTSCSLANHAVVRSVVSNNRPTSPNTSINNIALKDSIDPLVDENVVLYFALANHMKKYDITVILYQPDGKQFYTNKTIMNQSDTTRSTYYSYFVLPSLSLLSYPGLWRAEFFVDNNNVMSDSLNFKIAERPELLALRDKFLNTYNYYLLSATTSLMKKCASTS